jgi:hypothetical protein
VRLELHYLPETLERIEQERREQSRRKYLFPRRLAGHRDDAIRDLIRSRYPATMASSGIVFDFDFHLPTIPSHYGWGNYQSATKALRGFGKPRGRCFICGLHERLWRFKVLKYWGGGIPLTTNNLGNFRVYERERLMMLNSSSKYSPVLDYRRRFQRLVNVPRLCSVECEFKFWQQINLEARWLKQARQNLVEVRKYLKNQNRAVSQ